MNQVTLFAIVELPTVKVANRQIVHVLAGEEILKS